MTKRKQKVGWGWLTMLLALTVSCTAWAQETDAPADLADGQTPVATEDTSAMEPAERLALEQQQLAAKYQRFEEVLLRVAELAASEDPERAALLRRTVAQSKEDMIGVQLNEVIDQLKSNRLANAVTNQEALQTDLAMLLDLLLSEDRNKKLDERKKQVEEWIKEVNKLIKQQRAVQGSTESGGEAQRNAELQAKLADRTGELSKEMRSADEAAKEADGSKQSETERESAEGEPSGDEGEPTEADGENADKPADGKPGEPAGKGEKSDSESQPGEGEPGDPGEESKEGAPSPGQPGGQPMPGGGSGEPQESQQQDSKESDPAQQRLEVAQEKMREAQKRLEDALREEAVEKQEEALRELEQAKAELEEILRQLREEEIKRTLSMLEARFRKMLDLQLAIYEDTLRLDNVPREQWQRDEEIQAGRLSSRESELILDADKALAILSDDGTAVALPEAIRQMREDMQQVSTRLAQSKVAEVTQAIEEDIIAALEEIIAALEKAQSDLEEQQQQQQQQQQGQPADPPLVDRLAELKMIRALQMRVNRRTVRFSEMVEGEQAFEPDLLDALEELSARELSIYRVLRDIVVGRADGS